MKAYFKIIIFLFTIIFTSCEDVIDVDVQTAPARLTIEASLDWEKGTTGNNQTIKLSTSTAYFDTTSNTSVTGASVKVTNNSSGVEFIFTDQNNGEYTTTEFVPVLNQSYTLEVIYNGENYSATETLMPVVDIKEVNQSTENGFDDEVLEVNLIFDDPVDEDNYYLFRFKEEGDLLSEFEDLDDEFVNGNEINWYYEKEEDTNTNTQEFTSGDIVNIDLYGISEGYYNYIRILIEQSEGVGLFSATPVALKGNCINLDNADNYAHGYFRLTQVSRRTYTFN
ncbi:hypothetical protein IWQ47_003754 [Aquimarina sp. EL_43]|uniref:DUF4249 family protein n=1 Tax=Aquimarina TaxID=290174 RepID=UPI00046F090A|nr:MULTISPECIES: DUF4249 family protein [Aquimarina]MBG6132529.1 hypothetical protein [Aquimarina sp. EL_35]MBG6152660.1 hypothetical protein [Aquimarina sp. EL_32]MBG6170667.1 hypothetical protein [Aquimarina sp. EL_43]